MMKKKRKYKTSDIDVRVAIWEVYEHMNSYAKDDLLDFREMEIDHIIPQSAYEKPEKLKKILDTLRLPADFEMNSLKNYTPTRRKQNLGKSNKVSDNIVISQMAAALNEAAEKEDKILKKIEEYHMKNDVISTAANIAVNLKNAKEKFDVVDIILDEIDDFEIREKVLASGLKPTDNEIYIKSTAKISLYGNLPNISDMTPCCYLNFRTLKLRNCTIRIAGKEILNSLSWGIDTPIHENLRRYISVNGDELYNIVLDGCYFNLDYNDTNELANVLDSYCKEYIKKIKVCENKYDIGEFKCTIDGNIRLFTLNQSVCSCIFNYIKHNPQTGNVRLECNLNMIKLYSTNESLHAIIMLSQGEFYFWYNEPEFWFELLPYYVGDDMYINKEEWWSPRQVRDWFMQELIPNVIKFNCPQKRKLLKRHSFTINNNKIIKNINNDIMKHSFTGKKVINVEKIHNKNKLLELINDLQLFYNINGHQFLYLIDNNVGVYNVLYKLLQEAKLPQYSYEYISGKLDFSTEARKDILLQEIATHMKDITLNSKISFCEIEYVFRCIGECIKKNTVDIAYSTFAEIKELLKYTVHIYNIRVLIEKYSE